MKERLQAIMNYHKTTKTMTALSAVLTAALAAGAVLAGAWNAPAQARDIEPAGLESKWDPAAGYRYTQNGYYQPPYLFEVAWNLGPDSGFACKDLTLPGGSTLAVYYDSGCRSALKDPAAAKALGTLLERLREENTGFLVTRPLVVRAERVGDEDPAALAKRYYKEGELPSFEAVFPALAEEEQRAILADIREDGDMAFFHMAVKGMGRELAGELAEETYRAKNTAFFSILASAMDRESLQSWLARAEKDGRSAFRAVLYTALDQVRDKEEMEEALDRARLEEYAALGVTAEDGGWRYKGQRVRVLLDQGPDRSFVTLDVDGEGTVDVRLTRDGDGKLTAAGYLARSEAEALLADWADDEDDWDWDWDE